MSPPESVSESPKIN